MVVVVVPLGDVVAEGRVSGHPTRTGHVVWGVVDAIGMCEGFGDALDRFRCVLGAKEVVVPLGDVAAEDRVSGQPIRV
jgi:hypothetical protein